ncbi:MAG: HU family DNA-binding protein [Acidobacteriota bacterium]|nr:HU family DNA-binding protein [Acidobacteriota bacterium]
MKSTAFIKRIARRHSIGSGLAADQVDRVVNQILRKLKRGEETRLPGLGTIQPGEPWGFLPDSDLRERK